MWTFIGAILVIAGLALIWSVMVKKFPQLRLIDLSTLAKERHAEVKSRIMQNRFDRSLGRFKDRTSEALGGALGAMRGVYDKAYGSLKRMESSTEASLAPRDADEVRGRLSVSLARADALRNDGKNGEAERAYIEVLKLDPKHPDAYRGLADVYVAERLYDQAAETLEFLLRMDAGDDRALGRLGEVEAYRGNWAQAEERYLASIEKAPSVAGYRAELGRVYLTTGESQKAYEQFRMVLQEEPHNPKYLDYFLEASILVGDADAAEGALEGLEAANPENAKLEEFRSRIAGLRQPQPAE